MSGGGVLRGACGWYAVLMVVAIAFIIGGLPLIVWLLRTVLEALSSVGGGA